jgi:hypothetical protein
MDRHGGLQSPLTIAFHTDLYLDIIMDRYADPHTVHTIALHRGL